ncbi:GntR family transcriptional regulator [Lacisediminihabitans changchengi]|uniref:GntR family transcriptional regulator n=1 Tax=Lacisediminihabitans changchengi TaxID=2787634 RepID=A0A934STQ9_9MICO|nr:GntR family transcriptional regulator [Lacisediminihabitans changchengi]MBK4348818.1 GntR family transcriptional regulator [Lacisediminihabitans changchengi]
MTTFENVSPAAIERAPALIRDQVASYLRDAITSFSLRPGSLLVEREVCAATSTSRATVREAFRQLESEGIVVSEPGRGTFVATLTRDDARQIYEVRAVLEGLAVRLFTAYASADQIDELRRAAEAMRPMVDDPAAMLTQKTVFYDILFVGARNEELRRLWEGTRRRATLVRATSLSIPGRAATSFAEIEAIVEAIADRDATRAEQLCVAHIDSAAASIFGAEDSHFAATADQGKPANRVS